MSSYRPYLVSLVARHRLSTTFVRITLGGPELSTVSPTLLDQRVKLVLGEPGDLRTMAEAEEWFPTWRTLQAAGRGVMRTYTISGRRPEMDEVDIDVVVHPDSAGPVSTWADSAPLGSSAVLVAASSEREGHETDGVAWRPGSAREVLLVADETALVAATMIARALPEHSTGRVLIEVPHADDVREVACPAGVEVIWAVRDRGQRVQSRLPFRVDREREEDESDTLLWSEGEGRDSYVWVAGEAGWARAIATAAKQAGVTRETSAIMGYWRLGRAEM
ncbi:siderophore-interacting protein [Aestuariimicrobium ganziense]|uniref:siderophore-interacting protein n=1 Tax=Aestuariimicrobium ganziense TaxID=2773677 RepID=UPI001941D18E|nr:siderophore-interacting protein [Aestuariimicrobium ganziense]